MTFREDMYNLAFVTQAKMMYQEDCDAQQEEDDAKLHRIKVKIFGAEPAPAQEPEDDVINEELEEGEDESRYEFGLTLLITKPYEKIARCYKVWRYGEEYVAEMEEADIWGEENAVDEFTFRRSNILARSVFLFMTQGMLSMLVMSEVLYSDTSVWYTYADD